MFWATFVLMVPLLYIGGPFGLGVPMFSDSSGFNCDWTFHCRFTGSVKTNNIDSMYCTVTVNQNV